MTGNQCRTLRSFAPTGHWQCAICCPLEQRAADARKTGLLVDAVCSPKAPPRKPASNPGDILLAINHDATSLRWSKPGQLLAQASGQVRRCCWCSTSGDKSYLALSLPLKPHRIAAQSKAIKAAQCTPVRGLSRLGDRGNHRCAGRTGCGNFHHIAGVYARDAHHRHRQHTRPVAQVVQALGDPRHVFALRGKDGATSDVAGAQRPGSGDFPITVGAEPQAHTGLAQRVQVHLYPRSSCPRCTP